MSTSLPMAPMADDDVPVVEVDHAGVVVVIAISRTTTPRMHPIELRELLSEDARLATAAPEQHTEIEIAKGVPDA